MTLNFLRELVQGRTAWRIRYIARFIYWTVRHRSAANAAWVCELEGYQWN